MAPVRAINRFLPVIPQLYLPLLRWWPMSMKRFLWWLLFLTALPRWRVFLELTIISIGLLMFFSVRRWAISPRKPSSGSIATKRAGTLPFILGPDIEVVVWSCPPGFKKGWLLGNQFEQSYPLVLLQELMSGFEKPVEFRITFLKISSNHNV